MVNNKLRKENDEKKIDKYVENFEIFDKIITILAKSEKKI